VRLKFSLFARSKNFVCLRFDPLRVNDDKPLPALNPRAERVSYSSVFHRIKLRAELESAQGCLGPESRRWIEVGQRLAAKKNSTDYHHPVLSLPNSG